MVDLDYLPFFVDRVEDAVSSGPQAPQIWRSVWERIRWPRLISELADGIPGRSDADMIIAEKARYLVQGSADEPLRGQAADVLRRWADNYPEPVTPKY